LEEISALFHGFVVVLSFYNLMLMLVGILLGVLIGVLPGLGGANGVAILLPLTFSMNRACIGALCSAARLPPSYSIFPASHGR